MYNGDMYFHRTREPLFVATKVAHLQRLGTTDLAPSDLWCCLAQEAARAGRWALASVASRANSHRATAHIDVAAVHSS